MHPVFPDQAKPFATQVPREPIEWVSGRASREGQTGLFPPANPSIEVRGFAPQVNWWVFRREGPFETQNLVLRKTVQWLGWLPGKREGKREGIDSKLLDPLPFAQIHDP